MFSGCFSAWRWSSVITPPTTSEQHQGVPPEASMSDYVQAPLHSSKTSDIPSAQRATATPSPPEHFAAAKIAGRRATNWEDSMPETGGTRGSASCIAGRRATEMDGTSRDRPAGPPPDDRGSRAVHTVTGANTRREKNNVGLRQKSSASKDVRPLPNISVRSFTFGELAEATLNFSPERFLGEGGYGRVYKGRLDNGQLVAVKHLANNCNRAFLTEVLTLSLVYHPNLVNMIGYVADGDQRLLVYEYMPLGSLEDHLHDLPLDREPLDWKTRMKIAAGAARGLEYLHNKARPSIIHRDVKPSNILLDEEYHPKLSDFGLAKLAPTGDKSHVSASLMGTYGFCAPEYVRTKQLTIRADVYSFGVVLLELITGRKANDFTQPYGEHQVLVEWARCLCHKRDPCEFIKWADPRLQGRFPTRGLCQALAIASMCIQEDAAARPVIGDVMDGLSYLANQTYDPNPNAKYDSTRAKKWEGHAANRNWKARWMDKESNVADTET